MVGAGHADHASVMIISHAIALCIMNQLPSGEHPVKDAPLARWAADGVLTAISMGRDGYLFSRLTSYRIFTLSKKRRANLWFSR